RNKGCEKPDIIKLSTTTFVKGALELCLFMDHNFSVVMLLGEPSGNSSMLGGVNLLIAVGAIIMILGFLGCCGAVKESRCMLMLVGRKNPSLCWFT
uniref:Uncharacterized protein n=1 Tax=Geospiza parvula TaxID=87175 RepID=A0A8C3NJN3_GEOPR